MWNQVAKFRSRRRAGWWSAALLGVLLMVPAALAREKPSREERSKASSGSKASESKSSGSSAKASSSSSRSRSQPRASSRPGSAPRSQPRASSRPKPTPQPRASSRPQPTRRSESTARSQPTRRPRAAVERPIHESRAIRTESLRRNGGSEPRSRPVSRTEVLRPGGFEPRSRPVSRTEVLRPGGSEPRSRPVSRTEVLRPGGSEPLTIQSSRPVDRTEITIPSRRLTRPRYRTPAERSAADRSPAESSNADVVRRGPVLIDGWRPGPREEVAVKGENPDRRSEAGRRSPPRERHHDRGRGGHGQGGHGGYSHGGYGGHHHRHHYGCGHYGYGGHHGYRYDPFHFGFSFFSPSFYWDLGYGGPEVHVYGGGGGGYDEVGQGGLDVNLRPKTTEIYVDGVYVGTADQFDGFPSYLWLEEGTYEVAFYKQGYETIFRQYTIYAGITIDVDDRMRPGEAILPLPPAGAYPSAGEPPVGVTFGGGDGRIAIVATPGDAAVYLDGHFVGTGAEISELGTGLIIDPGDHVVEIIRPGYENQRVPVAVAAGERIDLRLDLRRQ